MKVQNKDNKGNPYHSDANGQFTSKDGGGTANNNELEETFLTVNNKISPNFKPRLSDDEYLDMLYELYDEEIEEENFLEQEGKLKPINQMSQEELLIEIRQRVQNLISKNISVTNDFFSDDLYLKCGTLRQIDTVIEKYGINNFPKSGYRISTYNKDGRNAAWAFAECKGSLMIGVPNTRLRCNRAKMRSFEQVKKDITYAQEKGWWCEVDENFFAEATICHEMGHVLTYHLFNKAIEEGNIRDYFGDPMGSFLSEIQEEVYNIFTSQNPNLSYNDFIKDTSKYGSKNKAEWFAETFMSMNGGKPTKTALALKQWLEEKFNFNGGNK